MQKNFQFIFMNLLMMTYFAPIIAQNMAGSNIITRTMFTSDGSKKTEQRVFDNGLGDIVQEIKSYQQSSPGPTLKSVIVNHEYDEFRRKTKTWLPVTSWSGSNFINNISSLVNAQYGNNSKAFTLTEYDEFLPSQPSAHYKAGAKWQDNKKKISVKYSQYEDYYIYEGFKSDLRMPRQKKKYLCTKTIDEDGCISAEYTDIYGKLYMSETSQGRTYYVYNKKGDLTHVFPPILTKYIFEKYRPSNVDIYIDETDGEISEMIDRYAYVYRYDYQRHCTYKKLPGRDPIYYIYDKAGRVVYMKDSILEGRKRFYLYDKFGRLCIQGTCSGGRQGQFATTSYVSGTNNGFRKTGYTIPYTISDPKLEIVNYYDNYDFKDKQQKATMPTVTVDDNQKQYSIGSLTGTVVYATNGEALGTINVYDQKGQVVRSVRKGLGGFVEDVNTAYTFTGAVYNTTAKVNVKYGSDFVAQTTYTYNYDKKTKMNLSVSHGRPALSRNTEYAYDDIGRLISKKRQLTNTTNSYCIYEYDMHGWLTNINSGGFQEYLYYADGLDGNCYNGNISTMKWKTNDDSGYKGYNLKYDDNNRLKNAVFGTGDNLTSYKNNFNEYVEYDSNGNITRLQRRGLTNKMNGNFGMVDNLYMTYKGNMLTSVRDEASRQPYEGATDFDGVKGKEYPLTYNASGSLVSDASRKIAYIKYDYNNNPVLITFTDGSETEYVYSATGEKLRVRHITAKPNVVTRKVGEEVKDRLSGAYWINCETVDYLLGGTLTLRNGRIDKFQFEEGYCQAEKYDATQELFTFCYYDQDHLGNIRQVTEADGTKKGCVIQKMEYYPFGAELCDGSTKSYVQNHKYNGKEFDKMHGLNTYDYGARQYNPVTARWDRTDPLAEKYYSTSPYAYCANNPVRFVDPNGMFFTDGSWELLNRLLNNINNRIEKNQQKINNIQEKINSGKYSDKKISKFKKDIDKYNADIKEMNNVRSEISVLEASSQGYSLSEDPSLTRTDGTSTITDGTSIFNTQTNIFEMKVGNGYELGLIAHELKHGYQFETGAYSSGLLGSGAPFYDQQDEWDAYNRGALFSNSQRIFALDKRYQSLQVGPKDFTSLNQMQMDHLQDFANRTKSAFRINGRTYNGIPH